VGLLERIAAERAPGRAEKRYAADQWLNEYLLPSQFGYNGATYPFGLQQTYQGSRLKDIADTLPAYSAALKQCPPAFGAQMKRARVLSQARFRFRNVPWHPRTPRRTFGTSALKQLERPWPRATTGELLSRMEWHAGLTGNSYVARQPKRLRVLRPDFTAILYGSDLEPEDPKHAIDGEIIGYVYQNGGIRPDNGNQAHTLLPDEVAHWSPIPDPESPGLGMSWVTAALKEIQGDRAATQHKLAFFTNGATPNMVVKGIPAVTEDQFNEIVDAMEARHAGIRNAYRTLYLTAGADATVVGSDLKQLDFKVTQGAGETRIALIGDVPAALLGISEGLAGSSLNAGNFGMARRIFADMWLYPTLQDVAASLSPIVDVPGDAELWFDTTDIPLLREDGKDAADIEQIKSSTITAYVREGFTAKSAVDAVDAQDITLLQHTGNVSVQLQPPGTPAAPKTPTAPTGGPDAGTAD
jgi:phage portal protein BeeE